MECQVAYIVGLSCVYFEGQVAYIVGLKVLMIFKLNLSKENKLEFSAVQTFFALKPAELRKTIKTTKIPSRG